METLGNNDLYVVSGVVIKHQTEKAWLLTVWCDLRGEPTTCQVWVPKSHSTVIEEKLVLKGWLLSEKIKELLPSTLALMVSGYEDVFSSSGCSEEEIFADDADEVDWRDLSDETY